MSTPSGPASQWPLTAPFRAMADSAVKHLPLYRRLCDAAAADPEVADRLLLAPHPNQRVPTLLLAAVHDVLLAGADDPLRDWYASVPESHGAPKRAVRPVGDGVDDPWPHFRRLALEHEGVAERLRTRSTQTNEVGRCATLLPALAQVATDAPGGAPGGSRPLALVEIGSSAGLNLLIDSYGYRYESDHSAGSAGANGELVHEVNASSPLMLTCQLRGSLLPPLPPKPPTITSRVGLDLEPVDIGDADGARWLVACQWPDQPERIHRIRTAIALAHADPPRVVTGDAVTDLAPLVEAAPIHALPVVIATWALSYLPVERQRQLLGELGHIATSRDVSLIYADQPVLVEGLDVPPRPDGRPDGHPTALVRMDWRDGELVRSVRLADQHPHGTWMEWLGP